MGLHYHLANAINWEGLMEAGEMHNKKILVVDDEESIRNLVKRFLGQCYTVIEAANGEVALEIAIKEKPDLVLMDIKMPKVDGYTACYNIKTCEHTEGIPVIIMSSIAYKLNMKLAQKIGADGYLIKPFSLRKLLGTVEKLLGVSC